MRAIVCRGWASVRHRADPSPHHIQALPPHETSNSSKSHCRHGARSRLPREQVCMWSHFALLWSRCSHHARADLVALGDDHTQLAGVVGAHAELSVEDTAILIKKNFKLAQLLSATVDNLQKSGITEGGADDILRLLQSVFDRDPVTGENLCRCLRFCDSHALTPSLRPHCRAGDQGSPCCLLCRPGAAPVPPAPDSRGARLRDVDSQQAAGQAGHPT